MQYNLSESFTMSAAGSRRGVVVRVSRCFYITTGGLWYRGNRNLLRSEITGPIGPQRRGGPSEERCTPVHTEASTGVPKPLARSQWYILAVGTAWGCHIHDQYECLYLVIATCTCILSV